MTNQDQTALLVQQVSDAVDANQPLNIVGANSKAFLGGQPDNTAKSLSMTEHRGVVSYEPTELVVTVRAGTPMAELNQLLADNGQMLPFEPPVLGNGTIGGVLATGLSGPARPFSGSVRDYVLGMRVINGDAQALRFGGEVMKNVAGYDAARLHVGAYGTLGVLLETSMKVLPLPEAQLTLVQESSTPNDNSPIIKLMRQSLPLSAATIIGNQQYLRLSGSSAAVNAAAKIIGGDVLENGAEFWDSIKELNHDYFKNAKVLWRFSVPEYAQALSHVDVSEQDWLIDWAGAQRFCKTDISADDVYAMALAAKGHATCYSADTVASGTPLFQPINGVMQNLQRRLRDSFDAKRLFNPGRFHPELDQVQQ